MNASVDRVVNCAGEVWRLSQPSFSVGCEEHGAECGMKHQRRVCDVRVPQSPGAASMVWLCVWREMVVSRLEPSSDGDRARGLGSAA